MPIDGLKTGRELRALVITPAVLYSDLDTHERMAVGALAMDGLVSYPKIKTIAARMGCSYKAAGRALVSLKRKGWLRITRRVGVSGLNQPNRYELHAFIAQGVGVSPQNGGTPPPAPGGPVPPYVPTSDSESEIPDQKGKTPHGGSVRRGPGWLERDRFQRAKGREPKTREELEAFIRERGLDTPGR